MVLLIGFFAGCGGSRGDLAFQATASGLTPGPITAITGEVAPVQLHSIRATGFNEDSVLLILCLPVAPVVTEEVLTATVVLEAMVEVPTEPVETPEPRSLVSSGLYSPAACG